METGWRPSPEDKIGSYSVTELYCTVQLHPYKAMYALATEAVANQFYYRLHKCIAISTVLSDYLFTSLSYISLSALGQPYKNPMLQACKKMFRDFHVEYCSSLEQYESLMDVALPELYRNYFDKFAQRYSI